MTRRNKFGAQPTVVDGIRFASKREAQRYGELRLLERAGEISCLKLQPEFRIVVSADFYGKVKPVKIRSKGYPNGRAVKYKADFSYLTGYPSVEVVEDSKGMDTPVSKLKRALVEAIYGVTVRLA